VKIILFMMYLGYVKEGVSDEALGIDWNRDIAKIIKEGQLAQAREAREKRIQMEADRETNKRGD